jgi:hypothetical protein
MSCSRQPGSTAGYGAALSIILLVLALAKRLGGGEQGREQASTR